MVRSIFLVFVLMLSLNVWADAVAESQAKAKRRYRDFIAKVKEGAADDKLDQLEVDRLKIRKAQELELKERARRDFIAKREARKQRELSSEMRDRVLEEQQKKENKRYEEAARLFFRQQEIIKKALKSVPVIDPHDEYEVGKNYEDDSGEVEEVDEGVDATEE